MAVKLRMCTRCSRIATHGNKCATHARERTRGSSAQRGYGRDWRRLRDAFLREHPICEDCGRPANEVHHKLKVTEYPHLRMEWDNLAPLCKPCHQSRTAKGE